MRDRAADAPAFLVGGDDETQQHYSNLTLPSALTNAV
jgi:hypothetical protein